MPSLALIRLSIQSYSDYGVEPIFIKNSVRPPFSLVEPLVARQVITVPDAIDNFRTTYGFWGALEEQNQHLPVLFLQNRRSTGNCYAPACGVQLQRIPSHNFGLPSAVVC